MTGLCHTRSTWSIDRLLIEAHTQGVPLEELGWRLSRRIEAFRRQRRSRSVGGDAS